MSDCRFGVSPVNYPDPDLDPIPCRYEIKGLVLEVAKLNRNTDRPVYSDHPWNNRKLVLVHNCLYQGVSFRDALMNLCQFKRN